MAVVVMETVDNGWVKLYRSVLKNPIVCKDTEHFAIWSYLWGTWSDDA